MKYLPAVFVFLLSFFLGTILVGTDGSVRPAKSELAVIKVESLPKQDELPTLLPAPLLVSRGVLNSKVVVFPEPHYPAAAKAVRASGTVTVSVTVSKEGEVVTASAVTGHPLLRAAAEQAAQKARFAPVILSGTPVRFMGVLVYDFSKLDH